MRGRLWVAVLHAGLANASAFAQAGRGHSTAFDRPRSSADGTSDVPVGRPMPLRRDMEQTNLGWIALLGLHSLTAPTSIRALPKKADRP
jgi:hypothetical protein